MAVVLIGAYLLFLYSLSVTAKRADRGIEDQILMEYMENLDRRRKKK